MSKSYTNFGDLAGFLSDDELIHIINSSPDRDELIAELTGNESKKVIYPEDPSEFAEKILKIKFWRKQDDIAKAVVNHRQVIVESGHSLGKSIIAACLACWWIARKHQQGESAIVIVIAPTWAQIQSIIFRYIRSIGRKANLPGEILETPRWKVSSTVHAFGLSPRKATIEDIASLQGYHDPNLLIIMDEAAGLPRILWDAVRTLATAPTNRILAIGNPISQSGPFWDACISETWKHIHMSCLEHPNVVLKNEVIPGAVSYEWVTDMVKDHCIGCDEGEPGAIEWDGRWYLPDNVFTARVLGQAPGDAEDQVIPLSWVRWAQDNEIEKPNGRVVIGFDPSRSTSGDQAAMVARHGGKILWIKRRRPTNPKNPSGELAGWLFDEWRKLDADMAYVDEGGPGGGVIDKARELGVPVTGVYAQASSTQKKRFHNLRTQMYWRLREALQRELLDIPDDDLLEGDITAPKYTWDAQGRYILEDKDDIRKRINRSPDTGDALAITFAYDGLDDSDTIAARAERNPVMDTKAPSRWFVHSKTSTPNGVSRWRPNQYSSRFKKNRF